MKIITGFKTIEDVIKVLKLYEEKGWKWNDGDMPLDYKGYEIEFEECQKDGGFILEYEDKFVFGSVNSLEEGEEQIHFSTLFEGEFVEGEKILVSDHKNENVKWKERIYLCTIPGKTEDQYICVKDVDEEKYKKGEVFLWLEWKYAKKLETTKELTIEERLKKLEDKINNL